LLAPITGFGFLEFSRKEDAMKVLKELQGSELDGR
jgi:RNA recognition motif-containing protein